MSNVINVKSSSSSSANTISSNSEEVDKTKQWFNRRFCWLFIIIFIILAVVMAIIVIVLILSARLTEANANAEHAISETSKQLEDLVTSLKVPLSQLGPAIEKLNSLQLLQPSGGSSQTAATPAPTVNPGQPIVPIVTGPSTTTEGVRRSPEKKYEWKGCENLGKCELDGYTTPPLVILSLDGFAREYLDRNIVQTFDHFSECGAKGERVYPSFPSKTFPNHYAIVTGLFPESHGITDNNVYDPTISDVLESMKTTKHQQFYIGEPIWSVYRRKTAKRAHCLFWPGCAYNNSGYPPDLNIPYQESLPFMDRADQIIEWLQLPAEQRPGVITGYLHEPDGSGHYQNSTADVDKELGEVDEVLDYLMSRLSEEKLLECINVVILSDHGMKTLNRSFYFDELVDMNGLISAKGVVGRLYIQNNSHTVDELTDELRCKIDGVKAYTKADIPVRKHYSRSSRVGDLICEGPLGSTFYQAPPGEIGLTGDHGYDFYHEFMHTIFFARGPSIKPGVTVPPFQNVQYMNLWMNLLGIEGAVETNGTVGFFDTILTKPPRRENFNNQIQKCQTVSTPSALKCSGDDPSGEISKLSIKLSGCIFTPPNLPLYSDLYCYENYCQDSLIFHKNNNDSRRALIEVLTKIDVITPVTFTFINGEYASSCPQLSANNESFAVRKGYDVSNIAHAFESFPANFISKVLNPLQTKTLEYLNTYEKLYVITGLASDENHDGVADGNSTKLTHLYRIIVKCPSGWLTMNPPICSNATAMETLSFIFPIVENSVMDCMTSDAILLDYSSTVFDVERIAGFNFQIAVLSQNQNVVIRRRVTTTLW